MSTNTKSNDRKDRRQHSRLAKSSDGGSKVQNENREEEEVPRLPSL